jgi:L-threonylcarbamoyladenylate synthase
MWQQQDLTPWLEALDAGAVTAAPAEGVYGYCADPNSPAALARLDALKQRAPDKSGYVILLPDVDWIHKIWGDLPKNEAAAVQAHFPCPAEAPVCLILQCNAVARQYFAPYLQHFAEAPAGIAVRVPACAYMQAYLKAWGRPLISTSANVSGQAPELVGSNLPQSLVGLTLPQPLGGQVSRIYEPYTGRWHR